MDFKYCNYNEIVSSNFIYYLLLFILLYKQSYEAVEEF